MTKDYEVISENRKNAAFCWIVVRFGQYHKAMKLFPQINEVDNERHP